MQKKGEKKERLGGVETDDIFTSLQEAISGLQTDKAIVLIDRLGKLEVSDFHSGNIVSHTQQVVDFLKKQLNTAIALSQNADKIKDISHFVQVIGSCLKHIKHLTRTTDLQAETYLAFLHQVLVPKTGFLDNNPTKFAQALRTFLTTQDQGDGEKLPVLLKYFEILLRIFKNSADALSRYNTSKNIHLLLFNIFKLYPEAITKQILERTPLLNKQSDTDKDLVDFIASIEPKTKTITRESQRIKSLLEGNIDEYKEHKLRHFVHEKLLTPIPEDLKRKQVSGWEDIIHAAKSEAENGSAEADSTYSKVLREIFSSKTSPGASFCKFHLQFTVELFNKTLRNFQIADEFTDAAATRKERLYQSLFHLLQCLMDINQAYHYFHNQNENELLKNIAKQIPYYIPKKSLDNHPLPPIFSGCTLKNYANSKINLEVLRILIRSGHEVGRIINSQDKGYFDSSRSKAIKEREKDDFDNITVESLAFIEPSLAKVYTDIQLGINLSDKKPIVKAPEPEPASDSNFDDDDYSSQEGIFASITDRGVSASSVASSSVGTMATVQSSMVHSGPSLFPSPIIPTVITPSSASGSGGLSGSTTSNPKSSIFAKPVLSATGSSSSFFSNLTGAESTATTSLTTTATTASTTSGQSTSNMSLTRGRGDE